VRRISGNQEAKREIHISNGVNTPLNSGNMKIIYLKKKPFKTSQTSDTERRHANECMVRHSWSTAGRPTRRKGHQRIQTDLYETNGNLIWWIQTKFSQIPSKVINLVEGEIKNGISSERIVIGGFSQGGATALYSALSTPYKFGGVLAMSTWLPLHEKFPEKLDTSVANKFKTPILQCHGDFDPMVPLPWAQASVKLTQSLGFTDLKFKTYRGLGHSSSEQVGTEANLEGFRWNVNSFFFRKWTTLQTLSVKS
jgi:predicted esterase